jgi:hypothetical protein
MFSHAANRRVAVIVVDGLKNSFALPKVNCKKMAGHHIPCNPRSLSNIQSSTTLKFRD